MSLVDVLKAKFPNALTPPNGFDFQVGDRGKGEGPEIVAWDEEKLGPQPTPDQIAKWVAEYAPPAEPTKSEKLASFLEREGLTIADLKAAIAQ